MARKTFDAAVEVLVLREENLHRLRRHVGLWSYADHARGPRKHRNSTLRTFVPSAIRLGQAGRVRERAVHQRERLAAIILLQNVARGSLSALAERKGPLTAMQSRAASASNASFNCNLEGRAGVLAASVREEEAPSGARAASASARARGTRARTISSRLGSSEPRVAS
jgi:hypothetical protein